MKLILSRKGFDSGAGKVPSPIFPDGRILSLPIPDKQSRIAYDDIWWRGERCIGTLVESLTRGKIKRHFKAHVDPDLDGGTLSRADGWKPVLGQVGASLGHLEKCEVGPGDLFLFFGLFREVEDDGKSITYRRGSVRQHVLFGWLQVDTKLPADQALLQFPWLSYHPHLHREAGPKNVIYVAAKRLRLPGVPADRFPGAGQFNRYSEPLRLSAPHSSGPGQWLLPKWFYPVGRSSCLTYHADPSRWSRIDAGVLLRLVSRGQEFVLDCNHYPQAYQWIAALLSSQTEGIGARRPALTR